MRRPLALFVLLLSLVGLTYAAAWRRPDLVPHIAAWLNHRHWLPATAAGAPNAADPFAPAMARLPRRLRPAIPPEKLITLRLKNGTVLSGELLSETPQAVTLGWAWGSTEFRRAEIAAIERGKRTAPEAELLPPLPTETGQVTWPYHHDVVVQLTNTQVIDARIAEVHPDRLVVQTTLPGGGRVEQEIDRQRVEQLLFRPVENARSQQLGEHLRQLFPAMQWYHDGWFTLISDSYGTDVREYRKTIRALATELYLTFFPILKDRQPQVQTYLVVFDDWVAYAEYAMSDGVPWWGAAGYFMPEDEVLYLFNFLGERFDKIIYEVFLGQIRRGVDGVVKAVEQQVDSRYHVFLEGQATEVKGQFEQYHAYIHGYFARLTLQVLRHELTHALLHHWGLQTIVLSHTAATDAERVAKKREYLTAKDPAQKRRLLEELLDPDQHTEDVPTTADNSWFVEGLAAYMETDPAGAVNESWLFEYQEAQRTKARLTLEFLTVFKMGSFPGVAPQAQLFAYGESWAFVHFLMTHHRQAFLQYLQRMATATPQAGEDLAWLLEATGQELRSLEAEFFRYMDQFPQQTAPYLQFIDKGQEIFGKY